MAAEAEAGALRGLADEEARARGELAALLQRAREEARTATEAVVVARRRGLDSLQQEQDRNARVRLEYRTSHDSLPAHLMSQGLWESWVPWR